MSELEFTAPFDGYFNYCLWPYQPVATTEGKLRSVNLLFQAFQVAGINPRVLELVAALRAALGAFQTVWGVKFQGGRLLFEFYFTDYARRERKLSATAVLKTLATLVHVSVKVNEHLPYFMCSLDVDDDLLTGQRQLDEVQLYIGNPGSQVSSGIAYAVRNMESVLRNFYFFFDARKNLEEAAAKVLCSAQLDATQVHIDQVFLPPLRHCHTLCVANKPRHDGVYFSGITVEQLLFFLREFRYPAALTGFVHDQKSLLDHLLFDVGFDYTSRGQEVIVAKSGFYGVF